MPDPEVHEIQLNGKQLVFVFMAATVVSVVIFLCGVMVGRGVRVPQADVITAGIGPVADPTAPLLSTPSTTTSGSDRVPITAQESLTYAERLDAPGPVNETVRSTPESKPAIAASEPKSAVDVAIDAPAAKREKLAPTAEPAAAVEQASFTEPAGKGYVVQVMATVTRPEAETIARRLNSKGYPTFISLAGGAAPAKYRVRVGKYSNKRDAEAVFRRLEQEEHFKPWLSR